jgi:hypothetical protein
MFWWEGLRGKRPFGRPRHKLKDNFKSGLQEVRLGIMDVIDLARSRDRWRAVVNVVMNLYVP